MIENFRIIINLMSKTHPLFWAKMTSLEVKKSIEEGATIAFLPFGSTEQHGPHLITGYDYLFAERLAVDLASEFGGFVLPALPYGMAEHHMGFVSTISVSAETLISFLGQIASSLEKSGVTDLVICNGHGGNYGLIKKFAAEWKSRIRVLHDANEKILFSTIKTWAPTLSLGDCGLHGGLFETSMALHTHPDDGVRVEHLELGALPKGDGWHEKEVELLMRDGLHVSAPNGVIGDPCGSTAELGKKFYDGILTAYVKFFREELQTT